MTTLHDRLADLADDAPVTAPPPDLWQAGKRRGRRARVAMAGGLVVAAALVGIASSAVVTRVQSGPPVVGTPARTELPDRFFEPSARLPVAHGGTGPLVAVVPAEHISWWGRGEPGLVGVSAVDQDYSFLNLSDWIGPVGGMGTWSLSPNGRWVAYWYGDDQGGDAPGTEHADGLAVLSTSTGEIRKQPLGRELGVSPTQIGWTGDAAWFAEEEILEQTNDGGSSRIVAAWSWDLADDAPRRVDDPDLLLTEIAGPAGVHGFVAVGGDGWYAVHEAADLTGGPVARPVTRGEYSQGNVTLSPDGRTVALSQQTESGSQVRVLTGTVAGDTTRLHRLVADLGPFPSLRGWLDDTTLLALTSRPDLGARLLIAVDVTSGETRKLSTFEQVTDDGTQLASDLLGSPVVAAKEPPRPWQPPKVAATAALAALALLVVVGSIRRRRAQR